MMEQAPTPGRWFDRLRRTFTNPRPSAGQVLAGVLCGLLAFAAVVQVRARDAGSQLEGARQSDLVTILDSVSEQSRRLEEERRELLSTKERLQSGADREQAALEEAAERAETLGILAGTLPATGPGIELTITDPQRNVTADVLLNTLQELRDAGAEAIELNDVRLVASTELLDSGDGAIAVDGVRVQPPLVLTVIGDPGTLATALKIPGGVLDTLAERGSTGLATERDQVRVDAVRPLDPMPHSRASSDTERR